MASPRHKSLAESIKKFHNVLRQNFQTSENWAVAWEEHKNHSENLKSYAAAMYELATEVWDETPKDFSRIEWVAKKSLEYFDNYNKLKLFDVGSCYNPFRSFEFFDVTAIDLCPAPGFENQIIRGDFLDLAIEGPNDEDHTVKVETTEKIDQRLQIIPPYDIVVFSFFLEYLPSPQQRQSACKIAVKLLKAGGLLFILRPDSNPIGEINSRVIKKLKVGLGLLGLRRIYVDKLLHLWGMAFVKLNEEEFEKYRTSDRFLRDLKKVECNDEVEYFTIAQDSKQFSEEPEKLTESIHADPNLFSELPHENFEFA